MASVRSPVALAVAWCRWTPAWPQSLGLTDWPGQAALDCLWPMDYCFFLGGRVMARLMREIGSSHMLRPSFSEHAIQTEADTDDADDDVHAGPLSGSG